MYLCVCVDTFHISVTINAHVVAFSMDLVVKHCRFLSEAWINIFKMLIRTREWKNNFHLSDSVSQISALEWQSVHLVTYFSQLVTWFGGSVPTCVHGTRIYLKNCKMFKDNMYIWVFISYTIYIVSLCLYFFWGHIYTHTVSQIFCLTVPFCFPFPV